MHLKMSSATIDQLVADSTCSPYNLRYNGYVSSKHQLKHSPRICLSWFMSQCYFINRTGLSLVFITAINRHYFVVNTTRGQPSWHSGAPFFDREFVIFLCELWQWSPRISPSFVIKLLTINTSCVALTGGGGYFIFIFLELPIPDNPCAKLCHVFNSLTLGDPYTHQRAGPASVKIHRNRVTHICVSKLTIIGADQASSNYLIRYWNIVDWTIKNKHFHSRKFISKCRVRSGVRFFRCLYIKILTCLFSTESLSAVSLHVNHTLEDNVVEILIKVFFQIKIIIQ